MTDDPGGVYATLNSDNRTLAIAWGLVPELRSGRQFIKLSARPPHRLAQVPMNSLKDYFVPLVVGVVAAGFSSYGLVTALVNLEPRTLSENPVQESSPPLVTTRQAPAAPLTTQPLNAATQTLTLNIYQADSQCQALVPKPVAIPAGAPVDAAVGKVLEQAESGDFDLAGYRVAVNSGVATIDLRLSPDAQRRFVSLSSCEQFALFGSLRRTLTDNSQLNIKDVRFTEQGQELTL